MRQSQKMESTILVERIGTEKKVESSLSIYPRVSNPRQVRSSSAFSKEFRLLASDFAPGPCDVICARGKVPFSHAGNITFRQAIEKRHAAYSNAETRVEKSNIVSDIVDRVRRSSPLGGFVKYYDGQWYEVGDRIAREKVGQGFRDLLHNKYHSSQKVKKRRRLDDHTNYAIEVDQFVQTHCKDIIDKLKHISESTVNHQDDEIQILFNRTQTELLEIMKRMKMPLFQCSEKTSDNLSSCTPKKEQAKKQKRLRTTIDDGADRAKKRKLVGKTIENAESISPKPKIHRYNCTAMAQVVSQGRLLTRKNNAILCQKAYVPNLMKSIGRRL